MLLATMTAINYHSEKITIYQNTIGDVLNFVFWISIVPHQFGITTIVKVAWIRRLPGEMHIHTP